MKAKLGGTLRIGWITPFTPATGVGTFSHAVTDAFPQSFEGCTVDLTLLHPAHPRLYESRHRCIEIERAETLHQILSLFDLLIYNVGNNREHHGLVFDLLRVHPGVVICHDYVYQHYFAGRSLREGGDFSGYAALLARYAGATGDGLLTRSRITSRIGQVRYSPWDSEHSAQHPLSEPVLNLGSALVVHSRYMESYARRTFAGPILRLGMPCGQKRGERSPGTWQSRLAGKGFFDLVTFGYIQSTKCIDLVLEAIAGSAMLKRYARYTVAGHAGDGRCLDDLRALAASLSIEDIVTFEINVSDARLAHLMGEADLFINLRKPNTEAASASLIEQLDAGRPVMVLASGCYAEVPLGAAIVLPADASSRDVRRELERAIGMPERMLEVAKAGRAYAHSWTCQTYAEALLRFLITNGPVLAARATAVGVRSSTGEIETRDHAWIDNLARARSSLRYADLSMHMIDPAIIYGRSLAELGAYVAHVILGIFGNARLKRELDRYFADKPRHVIFWACIKLHLIARAVFLGDTSAQRRVAAIGAAEDIGLWSILEHLPCSRFLAAASLLLIGRQPGHDEIEGSDDDDLDGFPKRLRLIDVLSRPSDAGALNDLRLWIEAGRVPNLGPDLGDDGPTLDEEVEWAVGDELFEKNADLSGFHRLEPEHVWARGRHCFVGLRLAANIGRVEFLVRHVDASASRPSALSLVIGEASFTANARCTQPIWLGLDLALNRSSDLGGTVAVTWCRLSSERATRPPGSQDTRLLGIALIRLRVTLRRMEQVLPRSPEIVSLGAVA